MYKICTRYILTLILGAVVALSPGSVFAKELKQVLILPFSNLDNTKGLGYLENSLRNAIRKKLGEIYTFDEISNKDLKQLARENYLFKEDFHTKSVAMNLGLLAKQDVVIMGGFRTEGKQNSKLLIKVKILDIAERSVVSAFEMTGSASSDIFATIEKIAERIAKQAEAVLPTQEEWEQQGYSAEPSKPFIDDFVLQARAGGGYYFLDEAERIQAQPPLIGVSLYAHMPWLWNQFLVGFDATVMQESPVEDENPDLQGLDVTTTNFMFGAFFGVNIQLGSIVLRPKLGGGYNLQSISVSGLRNEETSNSLPYALGALDIAYGLTPHIELIGSLESYSQFEQGNTTLLAAGTLGAAYHF